MRLFREKKVVCFGGGTGMPSLLSGLKQNPWLLLTAVVNMFDRGGSSGELRDKFSILPPGDILKCLLALAENEEVARAILLKRIENHGFSGHTGGNILLLGLEKVFKDYVTAVDAFGDILAIRGTVLPVTLQDSELCARYTTGHVGRGETLVDLGIYEGQVVEELFLDPPVPACEQALAVIKEANTFIIDPKNFYTNVLPNFLPLGVKEAINTSGAPIIFVTNLLLEGWGMKDMNTNQLAHVIEQYAGRSPSSIITNVHQPSKELRQKYLGERKQMVAVAEASGLLTANLWTDPDYARHDPALLAGLVAVEINRLCD